MKDKYPVIFTDGSNSLSTGMCAWAVIVFFKGNVIMKRCGYEKGANGLAELRAVVEALKLIPEGGVATICSDAMYAINALTTWRYRWEHNGYKTSSGNQIAHIDVVKDGHKLLDKRCVAIRHVKGHSGVKGNELADKLAKAARSVGEGLSTKTLEDLWLE